MMMIEVKTLKIVRMIVCIIHCIISLSCYLFPMIASPTLTIVAPSSMAAE